MVPVACTNEVLFELLPVSLCVSRALRNLVPPPPSESEFLGSDGALRGYLKGVCSVVSVPVLAAQQNKFL